jgi:tetratricopeptide (TPR) repeat protein
MRDRTLWRVGRVVRWALLGALLVVCPLFGCVSMQGADSRVEQHVQAANAAAKQHDFARAEQEWRQVLAMDPAAAQAYHNLGIVLYLQRKYAEAEDVLTKAVKVDPQLVNARVLLGASLVRQGKNDRAIAELEPTLRSRLNEAAEKTARVGLHDAFFAEGRTAEALAALTPLAEKYPGDVDLLYSLGQTYLQLSAETFQKMAAIDPQSYRVHQILAESLARQGRYRDALVEYHEALNRKPDTPGLHYQAGMLGWRNELNRTGEEKALHEFEEELKISPYDAWSEYRLGQIYNKWGEAEKAVEHFRRSMALNAKLGAPHLGLGRLLEAQGKLEEAQREFQVGAQLEPDNPAPHFRLAQIYRRLGQPTSAAEEMKKFNQMHAEKEQTHRALEEMVRGVAALETDQDSSGP